MRQLGYSEAYVNGAKGATAMRALHSKTIAIGRAPAADERGDDSDSELGEVRVHCVLLLLVNDGAGLCVPQGEYEVRDILAVRWKGGERQFLIRWKGYDDDENSWEV